MKRVWLLIAIGDWMSDLSYHQRLKGRFDRRLDFDILFALSTGATLVTLNLHSFEEVATATFKRNGGVCHIAKDLHDAIDFCRDSYDTIVSFFGEPDYGKLLKRQINGYALGNSIRINGFRWEFSA